MRMIVLDRRLVSGRSLAAGVVGAVLLHLLGWLVLPNNVFTAKAGDTINPYREYKLEFIDPVEEEPEQVFTQTNPDAPENEPDETNRFGARSQQSANEEMPDEIDPDNAPARESEREFDTDQYLTGDLESMDALPPPPASESQATPEQTQNEQQPFLSRVTDTTAGQEKIPNAGNLEEERELEGDGYADYLRRDTDKSPTDLFEEREGEEDFGEGDGAQSSQVAVNQPQVSPSLVTSDQQYPSPRPRRKLPRVVPSATRSQNAGVSNIGTLAMDSRGSELGEYAERMIETVSTIWGSIVKKSSNTDIESKVILQFKLTKDGYIKDLERLEGEAKMLSVYECRTAILQGQPYGEWTDSMIETHGEEKEIVFVFYYVR